MDDTTDLNLMTKPKFERFPLRHVAEKHSVKPFERGDRPRDHVYASELAGCVRATWWNWHYPNDRPDDDFGETRGALGHGIEEVVAKQIAPLIVAREVSYYDEKMHISGRVDYVVRTSIDGPMLPAELKSTKAYDKFLEEPMEEHIMQLRYYLSQMPGAPFGLLIYYSLQGWPSHTTGKDTMGCWEALEVSRDDEAVRKRVAYVYNLVNRKDPPPCEHLNDKDGCWGCSHSAEANAMKRALK
jgi:hypothetical protein